MKASSESPVKSFLLLKGGFRSNPFTWDRMESKDEEFRGGDYGFMREKVEWFLGDKVVQWAWVESVLGIFAVEEPVTVEAIKTP